MLARSFFRIDPFSEARLVEDPDFPHNPVRIG
jgi:hypothetical protein